MKLKQLQAYLPTKAELKKTIRGLDRSIHQAQKQRAALDAARLALELAVDHAGHPVVVDALDTDVLVYSAATDVTRRAYIEEIGEGYQLRTYAREGGRPRIVEGLSRRAAIRAAKDYVAGVARATGTVAPSAA